MILTYKFDKEKHKICQYDFVDYAITEGDGNLFLQLLKPTSFTPVLALLGIILYMFCKGERNHDCIIADIFIYL